MLRIDGAHGEGGGQLLRTAVALAALTGTRICVHSIRAGRTNPGMGPQHLAAVRAVAALCDARVEKLCLRAQEIRFTPGRLRGGEFAFDIGTAGSITLVLQALLPVMAAARTAFRVHVTGGTDVRGAPPVDYLQGVLLPLIAGIGVRARLLVQRRGYYPRGGGAVEITVTGGNMQPLHLTAPGCLLRIGGLAHVANLPAGIADRMRASALQSLGTQDIAVRRETAALGNGEAVGRGGAIVMWAQCEHTVLGAGRVAQLGVPAEALGSAVGAELASDLAARVTIDAHAADQILVYLALAGGKSSFTTRAISRHAKTAMWLIEQFLPVRFTTAVEGTRWRITVAPR